MGSAFYIALDNKNPSFDTFVNGKFLAQDSRRLAKIAQSLGIPPLEDYVSIAPDDAQAMMEDFGMEAEEIDKIELAEQQWFDIQEGLDLVAKLTTYIRQYPGELRNADGVLADLKEYEQVFKNARTVGARWNLQVDF